MTPNIFWYSADNGILLLSYIVGDGLFLSTSGMYISEINEVYNPTISKEQKLISNIFYNNPIKNVLKFSYIPTSSSNCKYSVINSIGETIYQESFYAINGNRETFNLCFEMYPAGIYFIKLETGDIHKIINTYKIVKY